MKTQTLFLSAVVAVGVATTEAVPSAPYLPSVPSAQARITVVPEVTVGPIKPMNAINGAPGCRMDICHIDAWKALEFPFARTHDMGLDYLYGAPWLLDVTRIFRDMSKDPDDPANYRFAETDELIAVMQKLGLKVFYRLGGPFENRQVNHYENHPTDHEKYARVCGNIVAHYNEGWANGFKYGIEYWEFWNEPDIDTQEGGSRNVFWGGSREEFYQLWVKVGRHLKGRFPKIRFGGPAICNDFNWLDEMVGRMAKEKAPLDFLSWHWYSNNPTNHYDTFARRARDILDKHGYTKAESILNEWGYVLSWGPEQRRYTARVRCGDQAMKGAAHTAGTMNLCQDLPVDMLMFYDVIVNSHWNSVFDPVTREPLPCYYAFYGWKKLARLGTQVKVNLDPGHIPALSAVAAKGKDGRCGLAVCRYSEDNNEILVKHVALTLPGAKDEVVCHLTDESHLYTEVPLPVNADGTYRLMLKPNSFAYIEW